MDANLIQSTSRSRISNSFGFTLAELMITVAIFAVLLGIAIPNFDASILNVRLGSYSNDLVASTLLARGEALKRKAVVNLCASSDGATCTDDGWENGWIVAQGTTVIQKHAATASGWKIIEASGTNTLSFQPIGISSTPASLKICRATPLGSKERVVSISATGRPAITKTTTGACP